MSSSDFHDANAAAALGAAGVADGSGWAQGGSFSVDPILDLAQFQLLEDQLDNPRIAREFARDFVKMWRARYQTLVSAVERGDLPAALDAILSLRTSSAMVGGVRLAVYAARLEDHMNNGDLRQARPLLNAIAECGQRTVNELKESYVLRNATSEPDPAA